MRSIFLPLGCSRLVLVASLIGFAPAAFAAPDLRDSVLTPAAGDTVTLASDLGPTSAPPWNPAKPVPVGEPWETALRLPGRIVSLPISGAGWLTRRSLLRIEANALLPQAFGVFALLPRTGVYLASAGMGDRTGFGGTVRLQPSGWGRFLIAEWSGTTKEYSRTRLGLIAGPAVAAYQYDWRPADRFYGVGLQSALQNGSHYASQSQEVRFGLNMGEPIEVVPKPFWARGQGWIGQRMSVMRTGREDNGVPVDGDYDANEVPSLEQRFPEYATQIDVRREQLIYGARIATDQRHGHPHWSHGFRTVFTAERFDKPLSSAALIESQARGPQISRFTIEAETGASAYRDPRTLRVGIKVIDTQVSAGSAPLEIIDLVRLGGSEGLAGFEPYRFHDLDALVGKLSYVFPLAEHFELDTHMEAGGVYPDIHNDPRIDTLKLSYGVSLRPRTNTYLLGEVGMDFSFEGVRFHFSIGGVR